MRIAILGAGSVGRALGRGWRRAGHELVYGLRDPAESKHADLARDLEAELASLADAARSAEVVVLAVPWDAAEDALRAAGDLAGKILVDCTNPLRPDLSGLALGHDDSGAEQVARWAPGAHVVKAFNTIGANRMEDPVFDGRRAAMFVCGEAPAARRTVLSLADDLGFDSIDAGPLTTARLLEPLALLWISAAHRFGLGRDIAIALLRG